MKHLLHIINGLFVMGNNYHRGAFLVDLLKKIHDLNCILGIQISCRLVCKKNGGLVYKSPCKSNSLLFSAGKLVSPCTVLARQTDLPQYLRNILLHLPGRRLNYPLRKSHIVINIAVL